MPENYLDSIHFKKNEGKIGKTYLLALKPLGVGTSGRGRAERKGE
jgi:hypothetical protein